MKTFLFCVVSLSASLALAQPPYPSAPAVVNQQVVQGQPMPPYPGPGPGPSVPPEWMTHGFREEWKQVHEVRPIREWENYPPYWNNNQQVYVQPNQYGYPQRADGFYYYPGTGNWQRDNWAYPQQQYYVCPQQQYYYPQYNYYQRPGCLQRWFGM